LDMAYHSSVGCDRRGDQPTGYATPSACFHTPEITITPGNAPFLIDRQSGELHILGTAKPLESYLDDYIKNKSVKLG
ncbi:hypothetical protein ACRCO4_14935, partial [Pseudomonas aeruginosa]